MKKVLVAKEKHGDIVYDISTKALRDKACLELFKERDSQDYYGELRAMQSRLYEEAKKGDVVSARKILKLRSDLGYEYEKILEQEGS